MRRVWGAVGRGDLDDAYKRLARLALKSHRHTEIEAITTHEVLLELGDMELERAVPPTRPLEATVRPSACSRTSHRSGRCSPSNRLIAAGFRGGDHAGAMAHVSALAHFEAVAGPDMQDRTVPTRAGVASYPLFASLTPRTH